MVILIGIGSCSKQIWKLKLESKTSKTVSTDIDKIVFHKKKNNFETNILINSLAGKYNNYIVYDSENIKNGLRTNYPIVSSFQIRNLEDTQTLHISLDFHCNEKHYFQEKEWNYKLTTFSRSSSTYTTTKTSTRSGGKVNESSRNKTITNKKGQRIYKGVCRLVFSNENVNNNYSKEFTFEIADTPEIHLHTLRTRYASAEYKVWSKLLGLNLDDDFSKSEEKNSIEHPLNQVINDAVEFVSNKLTLNVKKYNEFQTVFYDFDNKVHRSLINKSYDKAINRLISLESNKEYQTHELYYLLGLTYHLKGNLKLSKTYYLKSIDLYEDQEINYPKLALKLID